MASIQFQNPSTQLNHSHVSVMSQTGTKETRHNKENEHSFTIKVKEMATSTYKKITDRMHHDQHNVHQVNKNQKPGSGKTMQESIMNCMPGMGIQKKKEKHGKKKEKGNDNSSSDNESDDENNEKRKK